MLLIVWLWVGVIFAGVGFFPQLFSFVLEAPEQQHIRHKDGVTLSQLARRKDTPKNDQKTHNSITTKSPNKGHKGTPRASSSGGQGDCTTESHRTPSKEGHTMKNLFKAGQSNK